jgi:hypothetical protein
MARWTTGKALTSGANRCKRQTASMRACGDAVKALEDTELMARAIAGRGASWRGGKACGRWNCGEAADG